jgi:hypothetical protein
MLFLSQDETADHGIYMLQSCADAMGAPPGMACNET